MPLTDSGWQPTSAHHLQSQSFRRLPSPDQIKELMWSSGCTVWGIYTVTPAHSQILFHNKMVREIDTCHTWVNPGPCRLFRWFRTFITANLQVTLPSPHPSCLLSCVDTWWFCIKVLVWSVQSPHGSFLFPAFHNQGRIQAHSGNNDLDV